MNGYSSQRRPVSAPQPSAKRANAETVELLRQTIERVTRPLSNENKNLVLLALSAAISATLEALETDTSYSLTPSKGAHMSLNKFEQTIQNIGKVFEKVFVDVDKAAVIAEPFVDIAFPVIAPLYNAAASGAATATAAAKSAVVSTNTPVQNLVAIAAAIEPILNQYATEAGLSAPTLTVLMQYAQALQTALTAA